MRALCSPVKLKDGKILIYHVDLQNSLDSNRGIDVKPKIEDSVVEKGKVWKLLEITDAAHCRTMKLPDNLPTSKACWLLHVTIFAGSEISNCSNIGRCIGAGFEVDLHKCRGCFAGVVFKCCSQALEMAEKRPKCFWQGKNALVVNMFFEYILGGISFMEVMV